MNEINPNLKNFLDTNEIWKKFFQKNKDEFKNIRERLVEISNKRGISVTEFKKMSDKVSEGKFGAFMEIMIKNSGPVTFNFSI